MDNKNTGGSRSSKSSLLHYGKGGKRFQCIAAFAASISAFSIGNAIAWTSQISSRILKGEMGFSINENELGWIGSFLALGAACLALFIGYVCDKLGRKLTKLLLVLPMAGGWALLAWAVNVEMLYVGRILTGMAGGAFMVTAPLYTNEISQKEIRGALGCLTQLAISLGIFFDVVLGKFVSIKTYTLCCFAVPLIFGGIFIFMPETPTYYLKRGKDANAEKILMKLRDKDHDIDKEILEKKESLHELQGGNALKVFRESWKMRSTRLAFFISLTLMLLRALCGIDAITAYTTYIFVNATSNFDPEYGTIILMGVQLTIGIIQSLIVDRVGRKILLLISEIMVASCLLVVGVCFLLKNKELILEAHHSVVDYLSLIALAIYIVGFSLGIAPIPLMMNAEINPPETKSLVASFVTFCAWVCVFIVTKTFMILEQGLGVESAFFIYGLFSLAGVVFVLIMVPETKGKTSHEIREMLSKR